MTDRIQAEITATDNASSKFKQVAQSAQQMDQSLEKSASTAQRFSAAGAAVGAALGSLAGLLGDAARANAEAQVSQERLAQSIENTGHFYEEYADQLDAAGEAALQMGFDDEDAADSISTMTQAFGDAQEAINNMQLVMDIARARNIDLAAATKIVVAAEQERFGQLARIGIQLDSTATKEEALAALRERYSGQAAAYAQTEAAEVDRLSNAYENALEAVGGYTGQAQTLLMILPGLSAGFTALSAAIGGMNARMLGGTGAMAGLRGMAALLAGPVGIAALFAAAAVAIEKTGTKGSGYTVADAYRDAAEGAERLNAVQSQLAQTNAGEFYDTQRGEAAVSTIKAMIASSTELGTAWEQEDDALAALGYTRETASAQMAEYAHELGNTYDTLNSMAAVEDSIAKIYANTGPGRQQAINDYRALVDQWEHGAVDAGEFSARVVQIGASIDDYNLRALEAAESTSAVAGAFGDVDVAATGVASTIDNVGQAAAVYATVIEDLSKNLENQFKLTEAAYRGTTDALDAGFRTAVGNTNAIAQQAKAVEDWATNLIDAQGAYSELDKLVAEGRLSGESGMFEGTSQYAAAQRAFNSIIEDTANIQRDVLAIQAQQAPLIAQMVDAQADYIEGLRTGTAEEQMRALAYMDSATSAQALQLAQGYLENQDVFGPMIQQAAALNPYLALILEDMGVITRGADGSITLTGVGDAQSEIELLTNAIRELTVAQWIATFDGDPSKAELAYETVMGDAEAWDNLTSTSTADVDTEPATSAMDTIWSDINMFDNTTSSATANVSDNATPVLGNILGLLNSLDGKSVTNYVYTVGVVSGSFGPSASVAQLGGVMNYDRGGVVAEMGETGDEDLFFPGGGRGRTNGRGLYNVPRGTYVRPAPASSGGGGGIHVHIAVAGSVISEGDLAAAVAGPVASAIIDILDDMELAEPR